MSTDPEVVVEEKETGLQLVRDTDVDIQIATARKFPRSLQTFKRKATEMATFTQDVARECIYALPRKEEGRSKIIEGPSARFAEIAASAWTNLRAEGRSLGDDGRFVRSRGTAWDIENNVAIAYEVTRRITTREGKTYSDDMIVVTGNAGASIAIRNAILKVIPTTYWKPIYLACRQVIAGDAQSYQKRRDELMHELAIMGATTERVCAALGLKGLLDVTFEHLVTLSGFITALREGDTTIDQAFPEQSVAPRPAPRKSEQTTQASTQTPSETKSQSPAPEPVTEAKPVPPVATAHAAELAQPKKDTRAGLIGEIKAMEKGTLIKMADGFQCATTSEAFILIAYRCYGKKTPVEISTVPAKSEKHVPRIVEIVDLIGPGEVAGQ